MKVRADLRTYTGIDIDETSLDVAAKLYSIEDGRNRRCYLAWRP